MMIPLPVCQERAYESHDQVRSCVLSRSHRPMGGDQTGGGMKALLIVFLLIAWVVTGPAYTEGSTPPPEETLQVAKNRLASIADRKKALEALKPVQDSQMVSELIEIIRNPEEPIVLRANVADMLIESTSQWATLELKKMLSDSKLPMECRQQALYALWKKDPEGMSQQLISLAQSAHEAIGLRTSAINYLSVTKADWPLKFWQNLYFRSSNPVQVRAAALGGMETMGLLRQNPTLFGQVIQNPHEPVELRKLALLKALRNMGSSEVEQEFLGVLSKPENPLEIRQFALDNLAASGGEHLMMELKQILTRETNPALREKLKTLIDTLISKS